MKIKRILLSIVVLFSLSPLAHADEGMWMLPLIAQQNYKKMVSMGLKLTPKQIYNPQGPSLMDAVVQFGRGCTGEVVSDQGLVFTNHHCGYGEIQAHSSLSKNLLRDGFFAPTLSDELPNPGLTVTFTEEIVEVTDYVRAYLRKHNNDNPMDYLSRKYLDRIAKEWFADNHREWKAGTVLDLAPFYEGNRFILFVRKQYSDVRLVAAPPSCVGKYGADTDNWVWPRHSGDFSVFRIYTAPDGSPAEYSPDNIPLKPRTHLRVSTKGVSEDQFVMIMGFPGTTNHFYTEAEVGERRDIDNRIRIDMRKVRQDVLWQEMLADEAVNIQYAAKYASSTNAYKNAIGTNWAINKLDFGSIKQADCDRLSAYAKKVGKPEYVKAIETIRKTVAQRASLRKQLWRINEGLVRSLEIAQIPLTLPALQKEVTSPSFAENEVTKLTPFSKDYNRRIDRKVTTAVLLAYLSETPAEDRPRALAGVPASEEGVRQYVSKLYDTSMMGDPLRLKRFLSNPDASSYEKDMAVALARDIKAKAEDLSSRLAEYDRGFAQARHVYLKGLLEMDGDSRLWPDANFTLRYTFGRVKGYSPRDNVYYGCQTTTEGVLEKEDPTNPEYILLPSVKKLLESHSFGVYGMKNGKMPVNFCATTHTTGGNSGSPVIDAEGHLVGLNFDRNWEGVGGDICYLPDYQRSIIVDVRYVLFVLDRYLGADRLIREMKVRS